MEPEETKSEKPEKRKKRRPFQLAVLSLAFVWLMFLLVVYGLQPDFAVAATIYPAWAWAILGLWVAATFRRGNKWLAQGSVVLWICFAFIYSEDLRYLLLPGQKIETAERSETGTLRIVTLNSSMGNVNAAREPLALKPDVVLLQESPGEDDLMTIAKETGMASLYGVEGSILVRGKIFEIDAGEMSTDVTVGRAIIDGNRVLVVTFRLKPPLARADLWNPAAWSAYAEDRRAKRAQLQQIVKLIEENRKGDPVILGGDFNAVSADAIYRELDGFHDTCRQACRGWPNTALNSVPFARIDQIWVSEHFRAVAANPIKTMHSDHRMFVVDLKRDPKIGT